ncbi:unnamed protein product [Durusdinium trenchii]
MYHTCQVDDNDPYVLSHQSGLMEIARGLAKEETHTIKCGRNTEAFYGVTILDALLVDDSCVALSPPSIANELHVEFLGDSITAGWQVLLSSGSWEQGGPSNEDVFHSYAGRLAQAWTSNWRVVAQTSIGVLPHYSFGTNFKGMKDQFLCRELKLYEPCPKEWNFEWQADVVVINLGTNDFIFNNPSESEFQSAYATLIGLVRSKYPTALIFCIVPLVQSCKPDAKWQKMINGITNAVANAVSSGDERILLQGSGDTQTRLLDCISDYVDQIHPTQQGALRFAEKLLPMMTPKIRENFPEKCQGEGNTCGAQSASTTGLSRTSSQTTDTTIVSTSTVGGIGGSGAMCCYPSCNDPARVCNDETESEYCTSSPAKCQACGGELCGPTATSTSGTTLPATTERTTIGTTSQSSQSAECCYPDCSSSVCNPSNSYCSRSSENCQKCGGELCGRVETPTESPTSTMVTSSASGGELFKCCYPDCSSQVCNEPEDSPYCTSSPEKCSNCGGELCAFQANGLVATSLRDES